jgi:hypothetical protein
MGENVQKIQVGKLEGYYLSFKKRHCHVGLSFVFGTFPGSRTVRRLAILHEDFYNFPLKMEGQYAKID